jgi:cysteine desulfurase/selenocysteine lyase
MEDDTQETGGRKVALKHKGLDVERIRRDFPVLQREVHGKPLIYLDNAATSQKPHQVIGAVEEFYRRYNANVHRAIHELGAEATEAYEAARERLAKFINAGEAREVVFTRGATEALNTVAYAWGIKGKLERGDEIVTTVMEHHSNLVPWYFVQDLKGVKVRFVGIREDCTLDMEGLGEAIGKRTKIVTIVHCSNVLGTINDVKEVAKRAHEVGALCVVDAAQSVPHMPVDVRALGCDFMAITGHKMMGPTGSGALYGRAELLEVMEPFLGGGEMIREVHQGWARWNDVPYKFEAGTPNIAGAIGLGAAVDYLKRLGMESVREHEKELVAYALRRLAEVPGLKALGPTDVEKRGGIAAFDLAGIHAHDIASILDAEGIAIRSGHHCAQPLMEELDLAATARASFYVYNTAGEVDRLVEALHKVVEVFNR